MLRLCKIGLILEAIMINLRSHNIHPKLISAGLTVAMFAINAPANAKSDYVKKL